MRTSPNNPCDTYALQHTLREGTYKMGNIRAVIFAREIIVKICVVSEGGPAHQIENKIPAPHFYGRARSEPRDSSDIFQLKKCCYLAVQVDTFNRRPGVSQCYNCNLFNHSSKNCYMRTRCLKCGESHRTSGCPIRVKIANPVCINCNKTGHMTNWSQCEEFPKRKPKKGETVRNRSTITETNKPSKPVTPNLSFTAALSGAPNKSRNFGHP
ncbi:putative RNA-directed DNA polymerase from transposon BS [Trichonephila clavipes]|nr:putative RNA-directed DNA polymerase from transposon BS [Trichonephila clavipes]